MCVFCRVVDYQRVPSSVPLDPSPIKRPRQSSSSSSSSSTAALRMKSSRATGRSNNTHTSSSDNKCKRLQSHCSPELLPQKCLSIRDFLHSGDFYRTKINRISHKVILSFMYTLTCCRSPQRLCALCFVCRSLDGDWRPSTKDVKILHHKEETCITILPLILEVTTEVKVQKY